MCNDEMSLKWKIITSLEKRFNRNHTKHAELYYRYIVVPKMMKGTMTGIHVREVYPVKVPTLGTKGNY